MTDYAESNKGSVIIQKRTQYSDIVNNLINAEPSSHIMQYTVGECLMAKMSIQY